MKASWKFGPKPVALRRPYLGVHFTRCHVYGRLYRNLEGTAYIGRCPRCGVPLQVLIGQGGTARRFFEAVCP